MRSFVQGKERETPPKIRIHNDSNLTSTENVLRDSIKAKIYPYTQCDPQLDNHSDRGEVKTLAYIAVKGLLYFAAQEHNALQLVEMAESWSTGLDTVKTIKMYEIIYFLYVRFPSTKGSLRILYKYQYHLTS